MLVHFDEAELFEEIKPHLGSLINRLIFHVQANDIFHGEVQNQYPFAFEMAKIAGEELTSIFGSELEKSEIGYLALYFEMILRKQNSTVKGSRKQIAVVCTTGRGTAAMIISSSGEFLEMMWISHSILKRILISILIRNTLQFSRQCL